MKTQYAFFFDSSACSGCKACQIACKDKHDFPMGNLWRRVYEIAGGSWSQNGSAWQHNLISYNLSISCNHCEHPVCAEGCPTKAIKKRDDGIVYIDPDLCMGCKYCAWVCPYNAPQYNHKKGIMEKCDFCMDYIDQGKTPSCVAACPMRVLEFGELDELIKKHPVAEVYPLPEKQITGPALLIKEHKDARKANKENAAIINKEEVNYVG